MVPYFLVLNGTVTIISDVNAYGEGSKSLRPATSVVDGHRKWSPAAGVRDYRCGYYVDVGRYLWRSQVKIDSVSD